MKKTIVAVTALAVVAGLLWLAWYDFWLFAPYFQKHDLPLFVKFNEIVTKTAPVKNVSFSRMQHPLETPYKFVVQRGLTPGIVETDRYLLYLPRAVDWKKKFPLLFVMSPDGNAEVMFQTWRNTADKFQWILVASKEHRNGLLFSKSGPLLTATVRAIMASYPVDSSKVIAAGFSGGGMTAQYLAMAYPGLISAVVVNTAMIHEDFENGKGYWDHGGQLAVFLACPTDYRYDEMKRNRSLLERLGWKTKWLEFSGGHTMAPDAVRQEAAAWLTAQFK